MAGECAIVAGMKIKSAIKKINDNGALLVFPMNNQKEPKSLWSEFYPKKKLIWEWDESGDNRVGEMWHLMKYLSDCGEVVYSKWYQGRASFFSKELFTAMLCLVRSAVLKQQINLGTTKSIESELGIDFLSGLSHDSKSIYEILENDSPLSTKELKKMTELQGKDNEAAYSRALKGLFSRLLIVAFGQVDDGAFPSLAVGATHVLFEDLWVAAHALRIFKAHAVLDQYLPTSSPFRKFFDKSLCTIN